MLITGGCGVGICLLVSFWMLARLFAPHGSAADYPLALSTGAYFIFFGIYFGGAIRRIALVVAGTLAGVALAAAVVEYSILSVFAFLVVLGILHFLIWACGMIVISGARLTDERYWFTRHRDADRCPYCLYCTTGLTSDICPECGKEWNAPPDDFHPSAIQELNDFTPRS